MPCLLYKVGFVQTHGSCTRLCRGELQLSVKLITSFSMLLVMYMVQLGFIWLEFAIHAKKFSLDRLVFSYVITSIKVIRGH